MSALVVTFLSHLDVPNASALVFKTLQKGTQVVQTLMLDQLRDAEADMHILKASQISVNSAVSLFFFFLFFPDSEASGRSFFLLKWAETLAYP